MRIGFFGDSLTFGVPGVSFLQILEKIFPQHDLLNYGQGGDTALSLYRRIQALPKQSYDMAFLWVGVNDELVHASWTYPLLKKLRNQPWAENPEEFEGCYRRLVEHLRSQAKVLKTVTPLLIGEDVDNPWNRNLGRMAETIKKISGEYAGVECIDIRGEIVPQLEGKKVSAFFPRSLFRILRDIASFKTSRDVEEESKNRGLHFTLDGIHLNQRGADIAARRFAAVIRKYEQKQVL